MADPYRPGGASNPSAAYPPPGNPNGAYPPPGNANGYSSYPPPSNPTGGYPPPGNANGYPPPAMGYPHPQPSYYPPPPYAAAPAQVHRYRRVCSIFMAFVIIFGTAFFIMWLVIRPRIPNFQVENLVMSGFNLTEPTLSAKWDVTVKVDNPNKKMSVSYDTFKVGIFLQEEGLAYSTIPSFEQGKRDTRDVNVSFTATNKLLSSRIVDKIKEERDNAHQLEFNFRMTSPTALEAWVWKRSRRELMVFCGKLIIPVSSKANNGSLSGGPVKCAASL